jgi:hypothetical protein
VSKEQTQELAEALSAKLSPENLHADGNISPQSAAKKRANLLGIAEELTAHTGNPVPLNY